ncbi:MAG: phage terminase large subunit [Candidatus Midichloria sp.]|nr:phage terminase large subunit [Candidatus Midichloria sp.]
MKYTPKFDKTTRLIINSNIFESGRVYLPMNQNWLVDFIGELAAFPNCEHDDQVDSLTQFLEWIENRQKNVGNYQIRRL